MTESRKAGAPRPNTVLRILASDWLMYDSLEECVELRGSCVEVNGSNGKNLLLLILDLILDHS